MYLPPDVSDAVVRWFAEWSAGRAWVGGGVYEMFGFECAALVLSRLLLGRARADGLS